MLLVADLHLHSRYASGVSSAMTVENLAVWALRKGLDLLGTGDCLQADWLREIEEATYEVAPGIFALRPKQEARVFAQVPAGLRRPVQFVLSTEVDSLPPPRTKFEGLHHLLYFPSFDHAWDFRDRLAPHGDLSEGRPTVNLSARTLLDYVRAHGPDCHFAPAHILNPWFSDLGTVGGSPSLADLYGERLPELLAVETGLTALPPMCRRLESQDGHALFSCSDAHSLDNLGREYTVLDAELDYVSIFAALKSGAQPHVRETVKYPLYRTRYYLNWCSACKRSHDARRCPQCRRELVTGSRDRLERIASRSQPQYREKDPPHRELLPLADVIADLLGAKSESPAVKRLVQTLLEAVGHERYILLQASEQEIAAATTPQLAKVVAAQRHAQAADFRVKEKPAPDRSEQATLDFGGALAD